MKRFILKLALFSAIIFLADYCVGITSDFLREHSKGGDTFKDKYIKDLINDDIVIMGSSRALHHYVAPMIADSVGKTVYNSGMDGKGIVTNYGLLLEILNRYTPETIFYELTSDYDFMVGDNETYLPRIRPGYDIPGVDSIFLAVNRNEKYKMLSNSYRANSTVPHLILDCILSPRDTLKGYEPLYNIMDTIGNARNDTVPPIDPLKVRFFNQFIDLCKKNNIDLIFTISPDYFYNPEFYSFGKQLAQENNIPVIDTNTADTISDPSLFQDPGHLNHRGAEQYTARFISRARPFINQSSQ